MFDDRDLQGIYKVEPGTPLDVHVQTWRIVVDDGFIIPMYGKPPGKFKAFMYKFLLGWKVEKGIFP